MMCIYRIEGIDTITLAVVHSGVHNSIFGTVSWEICLQTIGLCNSKLFNSRHESRTSHQLLRYSQHAPGPRHDEILEGKAHHSQKTGNSFCSICGPIIQNSCFTVVAVPAGSTTCICLSNPNFDPIL